MIKVHICEELAPFVRRENIQIIPNTDGGFTAVDHGLTTQVISGPTIEDVDKYLAANYH